VSAAVTNQSPPPTRRGAARNPRGSRPAAVAPATTARTSDDRDRQAGSAPKGGPVQDGGHPARRSSADVRRWAAYRHRRPDFIGVKSNYYLPVTRKSGYCHKSPGEAPTVTAEVAVLAGDQVSRAGKQHDEVISHGR
jgi:hypothetical protein